MEIGKLILTQPVSSPNPLKNLDQLDGATDQDRQKAAQDFESVFINKLLDEMSNSLGDFGLEKDAAHKQINGIFNMYLARHMAAKGGFGLWKDIYKSLKQANQEKTAVEAPGKQL